MRDSICVSESEASSVRVLQMIVRPIPVSFLVLVTSRNLKRRKDYWSPSCITLAMLVILT